MPTPALPLRSSPARARPARTIRRLALAASLIALTTLPQIVHAQVLVQDAWVRGTISEQRATGAFMRLTAQTAATLVSGTSPVAERVEIHEMKLDQGVMKMRAMTGLPLPAGKPVDLAPGGYHLMLMGLKRPLAAGESVPISLVVESADRTRQTMELKVTVRPLTAPAGGATPAQSPAQAPAHKH
jgi:copper(I)-binding protein